MGRTKRDCEKDRSEDRGREVTGLDEQKKRTEEAPTSLDVVKVRKRRKKRRGGEKKRTKKKKTPHW